MTRSALPGRASPGSTMVTRSAGSSRNGSRSSKLAIWARRRTAMMWAPVPVGPGWSSGDGVLGRQASCLGEMADQAQRGPAGPVGDEFHAGREQGRIAAEFVDQEAGDRGSVGGIDHRFGADQLSDHAAAVDVTDQHHGHAGGAGEAHVGDVVRAWRLTSASTAGTLDQDDVGFLLQVVEAGEDARQQAGLHGLEVARGGVADHMPEHHDLGADFGLGFEEDGVHVDRGGRPAGQRLQRLGFEADLAAIGRDSGVVRHVLRLERAHAQPAVGEGTAQSGDDQGFSHVRAGALEHQRGGHQNSIPAWAFTPAAKWCFIGVISVTRSAMAIRSGLALRPVTMMLRSGRRWSSAARTSARGR